MATGLWWVVRSGTLEQTAEIARADVAPDPEREHTVPSSSGAVHPHNEAMPPHNGAAHSQNGAVHSQNRVLHSQNRVLHTQNRVLYPQNGALLSTNGDRRKGSRLEAYFSLHGEVRGNREWLQPWCLSRCKRIFDIVGAIAGLVVLSPLMIGIAIAVKLDQPGPVFFRQWRTGFASRRFRMIKFRTMRQTAEQEKDALRALNHHGQHSLDFKIRKDPRVTAVGGFLRRTSLDELPNLFNVLRGEMSLVGPRPTSFGIDVYQDWHLARLVVPPGITGLWQISGRSEVDFDDRVKLDCLYIEKQSILMDAKILLLTPARVFGGRGAC